MLAETNPVNTQCPSRVQCPLFVSFLSSCEDNSKAPECNKFVEVFEKLVPKFDCQRSFDTGPVPAAWLCDEIVTRSYGYPLPFEKGVGLLSKLRSEKAIKFFASDELRSTLDGAVADEFLEKSLKAQKKLEKK